MQLKDNFTLREVCGEWIVTPQGIENINFSSLINLNATAAFLFEKLLGSDFEVADMVALLVEEYEVSNEQAQNDCEALAKQWKEIGLLA